MADTTWDFSAPQSVVAEFDGVCCLCNAKITADMDDITCVDGEWAHTECVEEEQA